MVTSLSICSGIGGIELGLRLVLPSLRVLAYLERQAYPASVLLARMEDKALGPAPVFCGNLEDFDARPFAGVDIVTAGLPCQPYSVAGHQKGHDDERAIWPEFVRIVGECRPAVVFLENVPTFVTSGWFRQPGEELSRLGYHIERPLFLAAEDLGATHGRERVWILAVANAEHGERRAGLNHTRWEEGAWSRDGSEEMANPNERRGRGRKTSKERQSTRSQLERRGKALADTASPRRDSRQSGSIAIQPPFPWPPGPSDWLGWGQVGEALEPSVRLVADGAADWMGAARYPTDQLRCLGNSVVPPVAGFAFAVLAREAGLI